MARSKTLLLFKIIGQGQGQNEPGGCHGHDCMVVGFTTTCLEFGNFVITFIWLKGNLQTNYFFMFFLMYKYGCLYVY
jgi:hypothetical protein